MTDNRYNILSSANLHSDAVSVRRLASMKKPAPIDLNGKQALQLNFPFFVYVFMFFIKGFLMLWFQQILRGIHITQ